MPAFDVLEVLINFVPALNKFASFDTFTYHDEFATFYVFSLIAFRLVAFV